MGWWPGRSIKDSNKNSLDVARRQARKAFLALSGDAGSENAHPKLIEEDTGNGLDLPADDDDLFYKTMPAYVVNPKQDLHGFGIGALEELDAEDEDIYDTGSDFYSLVFVMYQLVYAAYQLSLVTEADDLG